MSGPLKSVAEPDVAPPEAYHERPTMQSAMVGAGTCGFAGLLFSAVQNGFAEHKQGALGVFTRTGSTIALFTAMGGVYSATDALVSNTRQKDDALNSAAGACAAGLLAGAGGK